MESELWHLTRIGNADLLKTTLRQIVALPTTQFSSSAAGAPFSNAAILNAKDDRGYSALHWAVILSREDLINMLVEFGADINVQDNDGQTPLHWAAHRQDLKSMQALLRVTLKDTSLVDLGTRDNRGMTPLHCAAVTGNLKLVQLLKDNGANLTARDQKGWTPLHFAAFYNHVAIADYFILQGCDVDIRNDEGWTPLHCAAFAGHTGLLIELIQKHNASIDASSLFTNETPLHLAVKEERAEVVKVLVEHGADVTIKNHLGALPEDFANEEIRFILKNTHSNIITVANVTTASGAGLKTANVGRPNVFTINAVDQYGRPRKKGGDEFEIAIVEEKTKANVEAFVKDFRNGTYEVTYIPQTPGTYTLSIKLNQQHIKNSPFTIDAVIPRRNSLPHASVSSPPRQAIKPSMIGSRSGDDVQRARLISSANLHELQREDELANRSVGSRSQTIAQVRNGVETKSPSVGVSSSSSSPSVLLSASTSKKSTPKVSESFAPQTKSSNVLCRQQYSQPQQQQQQTISEEPLIKELRSQVADLKAQNLHLHQLYADEQQQNLSLREANSTLQKKVDELTRKLLCLVCTSSPRNTVVMPCLHFIFCERCVAKTTQCYKCGQTLNGFLKVKIQ
jgi:ankyrin repeat protein